MPNENENTRYIALALVGCAHCKGLGTSGQGACICVDRSVFRIVLNKFRQCASGGHLGRPFSLNGISRAQGKVSDGRKNEDYMADVWLVSKRTLTNPTEWAIFRFHHLLGADWKLCCRQLKIDRGNFFHAVYRIEAKLGKVFRELQPYALWPVDEYFQGNTRRVAVLPFPIQPARLGTPLRPPLAPRPVAVPIPDPFEAVRKEIRLAYSQGQTLTAIANDLNSRGILPKRSSRRYPAIVSGIITRAPAPANLAA